MDRVKRQLGCSEEVQYSVVTEENLSRLRKRKAFGYRGRAVMERNLGILAASKTEREVYDG